MATILQMTFTVLMNCQLTNLTVTVSEDIPLNIQEQIAIW